MYADFIQPTRAEAARAASLAPDHAPLAETIARLEAEADAIAEELTRLRRPGA